MQRVHSRGPLIFWPAKDVTAVLVALSMLLPLLRSRKDPRRLRLPRRHPIQSPLQIILRPRRQKSPLPHRR